jgi:hypothetical protein
MDEPDASGGGGQGLAYPLSQKPADRVRNAAGWQLLITLLLGGILGVVLTLAYEAGQFDGLWPSHW